MSPTKLAPTRTSPAERTAQKPAEATSQPELPLDPARLKGTIVFVSDRGGSLDIWRMDPTGRNLRQLTDDKYPDADPRFSPDGRRILYTSLRGGFPQIWLMDRDGGHRQRITDGCQAAWSPDGRSIVFVRDDQVYVRELASGREWRLTPADWRRCGVPAFSPDGKCVALASRHLGTIGVFLLDLHGRLLRQLRSEDPCCTPDWSPDGKRIVFQTVKGHIHQIDLTTGVEEQLTFGADIQRDARYSPDGTMIVFCRAPSTEGPWQLCILDLESDELEPVQITHEGSNMLPDWHERED